MKRKSKEYMQKQYEQYRSPRKPLGESHARGHNMRRTEPVIVLPGQKDIERLQSSSRKRVPFQL